MPRRDRFDSIGGSLPGRRAVRTLPLLLAALAWAVPARAQTPPPAAGAPAPYAVPPPVAPAPYAVPPPVAPWTYPYPPPPPGYPGAAWGPQFAPIPGARLVYVELRSDDPRVRIDRVVGGARVAVCFTPCRKMLETNSLYIISGDGVRSTSQFMLPEDRNAVALDVQAGSTARVAGGAVLIGAGIVSMYVGALLWEVGAFSRLSEGSDRRTGTTGLGQTMVLIGIPAALVGLYLVVTSHTSVNSSTGATFTRATPPSRHRFPIALTPRGLEF